MDPLFGSMAFSFLHFCTSLYDKLILVDEPKHEMIANGKVISLTSILSRNKLFIYDKQLYMYLGILQYAV